MSSSAVWVRHHGQGRSGPPEVRPAGFHRRIVALLILGRSFPVDAARRRLGVAGAEGKDFARGARGPAGVGGGAQGADYPTAIPME